MKNTILSKSSFWGKITLMTIALLFSATIANAQGTTFAQFSQRPINEQTLRDFLLDNNTASATFRTVGTGSPIRFEYQNVTGLPSELSGQQEARIFISCQTTEPAIIPFATSRVNQPFNQTCTIEILRDTPTSAGIGTGARRNLLTAVITPNTSSPSISGENGADSAGFTASTTNQNVVYTSDFLFFANAGGDSRNLGLSFSAVTPGLSIGPGGFLNSFSANATGTFAASTTPSFFPPTAASVTVSGRVLSRKGSGVANARVTMIDSAGEIFTTSTNNFGYYTFGDVMAGQTVVLSVRAKRETYATQTLNINEDAVGFNFMPE